MPGSQIQIREIKLADAQDVARVHASAWKTAYRGIVPDATLDGMSEQVGAPRFSQRIREHLDNPSAFPFVVAIFDGSIIGFAHARQPTDSPPEFDCEIGAIYVDPQAQRRGVGQALVREIVKSFVVFGFSNMIIWCFTGNKWRSFYEKIGGKLLPVAREKEISNKKLPLAAYGWSDLKSLVKRLG